jgi:drug/metabolite transporter (DMT)-like permease
MQVWHKLGYLILGEIPSKNSIIGVLVMFAGLFMGLIEKRRDKVVEAE